VHNSALTHSHYAALKVKDAIVDQFRERTGHRPNVDRDTPDVRVSLYVGGDRATLSLEATGGSLHRRGYRRSSVQAPMQETLAAAIIRFSGWLGDRPLVDPFCGSGTLLAEALMHYCRIPSGYLRKSFGFERLPGFDPQKWRDARRRADGEIRALPDGLISGSDVAPQAVEATRRNLACLPSGDRVRVRAADFRILDGLPNVTIVCNPPHGIRLGDREEALDLFRALGDFLKCRCSGSTAFVYVGDKDLVKAIGLRSSAKKPLVSGALDGRCCRFDLFRGKWARPPG
jgi:putative N6-adenine-specific DNA methylase